MASETTIEFREIEFDIEFDYQPYEPPETGPEAQYPGCAESIDGVYKMMYAGADFCDLLYENYKDEIDELILESRKE